MGARGCRPRQVNRRSQRGLESVLGLRGVADVGEWAPKRCVGCGELRRTASFAKHPKPPSSAGFPLREPCGVPLAYPILWDWATGLRGFSTFDFVVRLSYTCCCCHFQTYLRNLIRSGCKLPPANSNAATGTRCAWQATSTVANRCRSDHSCDGVPLTTVTQGKRRPRGLQTASQLRQVTMIPEQPVTCGSSVARIRAAHPGAFCGYFTHPGLTSFAV